MKKIVLRSQAPLRVYQWEAEDISIINIFTLHDEQSLLHELQNNADYASFQGETWHFMREVYHVRLPREKNWRGVHLKVFEKESALGRYPKYDDGWKMLQDLGFEVCFIAKLFWWRAHPFEGELIYHFYVRLRSPLLLTEDEVRAALISQIPADKAAGDLCGPDYASAETATSDPDATWSAISQPLAGLECFYRLEIKSI